LQRGSHAGAFRVAYAINVGYGNFGFGEDTLDEGDDMLAVVFRCILWVGLEKRYDGSNGVSTLGRKPAPGGET
jgi:hypothetical protein